MFCHVDESAEQTTRPSHVEVLRLMTISLSGGVKTLSGLVALSLDDQDLFSEGQVAPFILLEHRNQSALFVDCVD